MRKYWKSIEEYESGIKNASSQIPEKQVGQKNLKSSRRDFLKYFGFSVASTAVLSSCERPVKKAIPLFIQPEEIRPGIASYYASTFYNGNEAVPILVKVRDGRPIKIEGNDLSSLTHGGTSAQAQASLLGLYDESRPKEPTFNGETISWNTANANIISQLQKISSDKEIVFITPTLLSPSLNSLINQLKNKYPNTNQIILDSYSYSGIREAYKLYTSEQIIPFYQFHKAEVIVSIEADFLGTWLMPTTFTHQYTQNRKLSDKKNTISKHIQFESTLSLTGSNADERYSIKPSEHGKYILSLYNEIAKLAGERTLSKGGFESQIRKTAQILWNAREKALVVSGSNQKDIQCLAIGINQMLEAYNNTIRIDKEIQLYQGNDNALLDFQDKCQQGKIGAIVCLDSNPLYYATSFINWEEALNKVDLSINISSQKDETGEMFQYQLPANHYLESWNDAEIITGEYSLSQPVIQPLFNTNDIHQILLNWLDFNTETHDYIRTYWNNNILTEEADTNSFVTRWKNALSKGVYTSLQEKTISFNQIDINKIASQIAAKPRGNTIEFTAFQSVSIGDGRMANNPWLQELPDPITKVCWDNYFSVSAELAKEKKLKPGDIINIDGIELPVYIQPGQHPEVISAALGYGRKMESPKPEVIGKNINSLLRIENNAIHYHRAVKNFEFTEKTYELATTQTHHSMEGRAIIRETSIAAYKKNPAAGNEIHEKIEKHHSTLYEKHSFPGHHWAMLVDLNACTGCNTCVIACSVENNVPVVGRNEVRRSHEMHWLRIDRYYTQKTDNPNSLRVVRQPVMCQHCDNAPCENVCPVAATNHSSEGINQMAYNRCIGTRYCNNNCPYKVRRFNWFDYTGADAIPNNRKDATGISTDMKRLVLNPDVTVRAKGVIEKCSFCIQRIQEKKLEAKKKRNPLKDGDIQTACQQSCPAKAITFGDLNDKNSAVSQLLKNPRAYHLLEELHTLPSVGYLTKVRNIDDVIDKNTKHKSHS
jgi:molybdopterin-containing oxidoreductase family iron-sulfur binding subunit